MLSCHANKLLLLILLLDHIFLHHHLLIFREKSNVVYLLNENGSIIYATEYRGPSVNGDPRSADHPEFTESYAAFSLNGSAEVWFSFPALLDLSGFKY